MAELGNSGRSTAARTSSVRTRPAAVSIGTASPSSGCTCSRTAASASSTPSRPRSLAVVGRGAMDGGYWPVLGGMRSGYARAVISVVVPVYDEERSVALLYEELQAALDPLPDEW